MSEGVAERIDDDDDDTVGPPLPPGYQVYLCTVMLTREICSAVKSDPPFSTL